MGWGAANVRPVRAPKSQDPALGVLCKHTKNLAGGKEGGPPGMSGSRCSPAGHHGDGCCS